MNSGAEDQSPEFSSQEPRIFIAAPFKSSFIETVAEYQNAMKSVFRAVHWIPPENFHLTIKFFGETKLSKIDNILRRAERVIEPFSELEIDFHDYGYFGSPRSPRVLYLKGNAPELTALAEAILKEFPDERYRPFRAHLTLGKFLKRQSAVDISHNEKLIRLWQERGAVSLGLPQVKTSTRIKELALMETIWIGRAVEYVARHHLKLRSV